MERILILIIALYLMSTNHRLETFDPFAYNAAMQHKNTLGCAFKLEQKLKNLLTANMERTDEQRF